jgi:hypothetical protein
MRVDAALICLGQRCRHRSRPVSCAGVRLPGREGLSPVHLATGGSNNRIAPLMSPPGTPSALNVQCFYSAQNATASSHVPCACSDCAGPGPGQYEQQRGSHSCFGCSRVKDPPAPQSCRPRAGLVSLLVGRVLRGNNRFAVSPSTPKRASGAGTQSRERGRSE